ncbi:hypothetical protein KEM55_005081, partial [Ascosphaera atra]
DRDYDAAHRDMMDEDAPHHYGTPAASHYPSTYHPSHPHPKSLDHHAAEAQQQQQQQQQQQGSSPITQQGPGPGPGPGVAHRYEPGPMHHPHLHLPHPTAHHPAQQHPSQEDHAHAAAAAAHHPPAAGAAGPTSTTGAPGAANHGAPFFEHFDPILDADPFGLTASMHFQTPFGYHHASQQQQQQQQQQQAAAAAAAAVHAQSQHAR